MRTFLNGVCACPATTRLSLIHIFTFDDDYTEIHSTFTKGSTVTLNRWYMDKFITYRSETDLEGAYKRCLLYTSSLWQIKLHA